MIPRRLHQIWLESRPQPAAWMDTWRSLTPTFDVRVWDEARISALGLRNRSVFDRSLEEEILHGAADVARVEILRPMWRLTGPGALTDVLERSEEADITVLPAWMFYATTIDGASVTGGEPLPYPR